MKKWIHFLRLFCLLVSSNLLGQSFCVNFSPYYIPGQNPENQTYLPPEQLDEALDFIASYCGCIKTFASQSPLDTIAYLAKEKGFETVILGIWLNSDSISNEAEIQRAIEIAQDGVVDRIVVGSEVLLRGDLSAEELLAYIQYVQEQLPNIPVTTADVYGKLIEHPEIVAQCDWLAPNIYPFWQGSDLACSIFEFHRAYTALETIANGKEIWISETGHPYQGNTVGEAIPSLEDMLYYLQHIRAWSAHHSIPVFYFSAFSEPWKYNLINPQEAYWGLSYYDEETTSLVWNEGVEAILAATPEIDTSLWACEFIENEVDSARIIITHIPVYGDSQGQVYGYVDGVNPCDVGITTYIKVNNRWWVKPTYEQRVIYPDCNGEFCIDFTTGGGDRYATDIWLGLIPSDWSPPGLGNVTSLPDSLFQNTITDVLIQRTPFDYGFIGVLEPEGEVAALDTIVFPVFAKNIVDVLSFSGGISVHGGGFSPQFISYTSYFGPELDIQILNDYILTFQYHATDSSDLLTIPDSTILFELETVLPADSYYCRRISPSNDSLALRVTHFIDSTYFEVPMQTNTGALICPATPIRLELESEEELETGGTTELKINIIGAVALMQMEASLTVSEGLKITSIDSSWNHEPFKYELVNESQLHFGVDTTQQDWVTLSHVNPTICSITIEALENIETCQYVYFDQMLTDSSVFRYHEPNEIVLDALDSLAYCFDLTNLIETEKEAFIRCYPNPVRSHENISIEIKNEIGISSSIAFATWYNVLGQMVASTNNLNPVKPLSNYQLETPSQKGIYLLVLTAMDGQSWPFKIQVQ